VADCASVRTCYNIGRYAYKTYNNTRRNLHNISVNLHKYCGLIQAISVLTQVDASTKGLGATLLQEDRPVDFASKDLTDVESRYANIKRELLAFVYGCEKFHTYLYGRSFTVQSDHKPLKYIHLKHLTSAPPRLQRMLLRLQPYRLTIKYRQGAYMEIADALSRLSPQETEPISDVQIHEICPQFSTGILQEIRVASATDSELN
jgi:hypothetical protein